MVTFIETRKSIIVYPHLGIKEEVEEEVFVTTMQPKDKKNAFGKNKVQKTLDNTKKV